MKIYLLIIIFWLVGCCCSSASVLPSDTLSFIHETEAIKPMVPDTQVLSNYKSNPSYDYYNYQVRDSRSLTEIIGTLLQRFLSHFWNATINADQASIAAWVILGVIFVGIILLLYFLKPGWFYVDRKKKPAYRVEEESIYGIDFDQMIREALSSDNFADAIRWRYLQTLKRLQDKELISWDPNKTVNEYVAVFKRSDLKPGFSQLSRLFLYFRYGNFEAGQSEFKEVDQLAAEIIQRL